MIELWYWFANIFSTIPPAPLGPPGETDDPTDRN